MADTLETKTLAVAEDVRAVYNDARFWHVGEVEAAPEGWKFDVETGVHSGYPREFTVTVTAKRP